MQKKRLDIVKIIAIIMIGHAIWLLVALKQLSVQMDSNPSKGRTLYLLAHSLPILLSSIILFIFALNILIKKKLSLKMLLLGSFLSWIGCFGWFLCQKRFEQLNDWQVFYSAVFLFPIFLIYFFTRRRIKEQLK